MTDGQVSPSRANPATQSPTIQRFSLSGAWNWAKGKVKQGANWVKGKVNQGINWAKGTLGKVGDWALDKLAALLENVPGWHLLTVLLGKNPITGEAVPRTDRNLVEGMVKLAPMGQLTFQALDARGGIDRAAQWLTAHRAKYLLTNQDILKLTDKALGYAKDWKMGEAMAVIKIGLGRLFQLGSAALIKFIEIAIEKVLDFTIWLVEQIPPAAFMPLTPLVFVFKHGMIGFLTKLRGQGGAKLLQMLLNIGKAITSPGFIWAYIKGIVKGFFVDGLWGTITFLWEIVKLPFTIGKFIFNLAKYLSSPEWIKKVVAITKAIQETGTWLKENGTSMIQDLQKEAGGGGGIQLGAIFNALVSSAAGWVQKGGEKMADQMIAFFSQSPDKLGPALGNTVGTVVGMVLFEVVLSAVTFGGGSAVTATKNTLRPIFKLLGGVGAGALKAITTIAAKLRKWISGAAKALLSYISKISRKVGSKVGELFGQLRKWVDELVGISESPLNRKGKFKDPDLQARYEKYVKKKTKQGKKPREPLDWKKQIDFREGKSNIGRGNTFNQLRSKAYPYNEVYILRRDPKTGKGKYVILDSYDPRKGEIVSRKDTQLGEIQFDTAKKYLDELAEKYSPGSEIADVPTARKGGRNDGILIDPKQKTLKGKMYLEIRPQNGPIPQGILDYADGKGIFIRDSNGIIY